MEVDIDYVGDVAAEVDAASVRPREGWDLGDALTALKLEGQSAPPWTFGRRTAPDLVLPSGALVSCHRQVFGSIALHTAFCHELKLAVLLHVEVVSKQA